MMPADLAATSDPRARKIVADNPNFIQAPGLVRLEKVYLQGVEIPLEESRPVWMREIGREEVAIRTTMPLLSVSDHPEHGTVIYRAELSNDGRWPVGADIYVIGDWAEDQEEAKPQAKKK